MPVTSYSNESRFVKHLSCPSCGSSDANGLYTDGHTFCHKCFTRTDGGDVSEYEVKEKKMSNFKFYEDGKTATITDRNIGSSTCQAYGVRLAEDKHFYPYYDDNGSIVAVKTRNVSTKSFSIMGDFNKATLFGQNLFQRLHL